MVEECNTHFGSSGVSAHPTPPHTDQPAAVQPTLGTAQHCLLATTLVDTHGYNTHTHTHIPL